MTDDTTEVDAEMVDTALMTRERKRHPQLDGYAEMYQAVLGLRAATRQNASDREEIAEGTDDIDIPQLDNHLSRFQQEIQNRVMAEHEHAVRWTLDSDNEK